MSEELKLQVIGERILVEMEVVSKEEKLSSGLIVETDQTEPKTHVRGKVVQLGKGDFSVEVGDHIMYHSRAGIDLEHNDITYSLLREQDIFATYDKDEEDPSVELKGLDADFLKQIKANQ